MISSDTPIRQAVALEYGPASAAPRVMAKGRGEIAEAILSKARELGIPMKAEPLLVAFLLEIDLYRLVPPELYEAVAQVLAWAYENDQKFREKTTPAGS